MRQATRKDSVFGMGTLAAAPSETGKHPARWAPGSRTAEHVAQAGIAALLYAVPALVGLYGAGVADPDVWWHLRSGQWIVQHHAVPHLDPFSATTMGRPWAAYSWLFDLTIYGFYARLGLAGIMAYAAVLTVALTAALHRLVQHRCADFNVGVLLTFAACYGMLKLQSPRPWLWTILLFTLELGILSEARASGRSRALLWLPPLFTLWANLHIQFIDGLIVLALAFAEAAARHWRRDLATRAPAGRLAAVAVFCCAAACINPYGWHIYRVAYGLATQPGVLNTISELGPIPFRSSQDYCVLAIALCASGVLAARRRVLSFEGLLLAFAAVTSFRSQRDVWIMAVAGAWIIAAYFSSSSARREVPGPLSTTVTLLLAGVLALSGALLLRINDSRMQMMMVKNLPVNAVRYTQQHNLRGPVFNDYGWGGYLIWTLREPVEIDGRADLHGTAQIDRSRTTWNGEPGWTANKGLRAAQVVIGPAKMPLVQLLRVDPDFRLAYSDDLAAVFVRTHPAPPLRR